MNLRATKDKVIVKPAPAVERIEGGIVIPAVGKTKPFHEQGEVVAVASNVDAVQPGQDVLFRHGAGIKMRLEGEDYLALHNDDLFAVVEA